LSFKKVPPLSFPVDVFVVPLVPEVPVPDVPVPPVFDVPVPDVPVPLVFVVVVVLVPDVDAAIYTCMTFGRYIVPDAFAPSYIPAVYVPAFLYVWVTLNVCALQRSAGNEML
jgi:hypothetical protein